jgi:YihY family inner membrane protein
MAGVSSFLEKADRVQQRHRVPAFIVAVFKRFGDDRGGSLAALMTYYGFLSLFPLLLVGFTLAGFLLPHYPSAEDTVARSVLQQFPVVGPQLQHSLTANVHPIRGSGLALVVGLVGALWGGLGVTQATQMAMADVWSVEERRRPGLALRAARGLLLLGVLVVGIVVSSGTVVLVSSLSGGGGARAVLLLLACLSSIGVALLAYKVVSPPSVWWRDLLPGAVVAGLGWQLLQTIGVVLLTRQLRHSSQVYGTFATVLGLLAVLSLTAQLAVVGAEISVVRARHLWPRSLLPDHPTDPDERVLADLAQRQAGRDDERVAVEFEGSTGQDAKRPSHEAGPVEKGSGARRRMASHRS